MSAGAFISAATEEIWFAPGGVIGAAAAVTAEGQDIPETMRLKLNSFLRAKIRAISEGKGYRGEVVSAMIDKDYELKIGDKLIKGKGELLSLTATEAAKTYGEPPRALLAAGIAKDIDELLTKKYGAGNYEKRTFEVTWSEELARYLSKVSPILLGLGLLALFIEFKTPGFGVFGISGIVLLAIVFLSNYAAGLSGHEPMLVFAVGLICLVLELVFFPGTVVVALIGLVLMVGALLWSMADIWPNQPLVLSGDLLIKPLQNLLIALVVAGGVLALVARFLPHGWIWQRLAVGGAVQGAGVTAAVLDEQESLVGREGVAATSLFPSGQIEIDGRRYEARLEVGFVEAGTHIRVVRRTGFGLIVEAKKP
jgi:membrane-bound serine protease (ClpP class)